MGTTTERDPWQELSRRKGVTTWRAFPVLLLIAASLPLMAILEAVEHLCHWIERGYERVMTRLAQWVLDGLPKS